MFRRNLKPAPESTHILLDPALSLEEEYTSSFGFEWTEIDGYANKETMSHGHLFGRFILPANFMQKKIVADVGCGNGRLGRLIAPDCARYVGLDMSKALYAFPTHVDNFDNVTLVRASATDLPLESESVDVALCWGVLHHIDDPDKALLELFRITKPGGQILIYVYPPQFDSRKNLNLFVREIPDTQIFKIAKEVSDEIDDWCDVEDFFGKLLAQHLFISQKNSRNWQLFQWFDGISPKYHWSLTEMLISYTKKESLNCQIADQARGIFKFTVK